MADKNWTLLSAYFSPRRFDRAAHNRLEDEFPANALLVVKGFAGQKSVILKRSGGWCGRSIGDGTGDTGGMNVYMEDAAGNRKSVRVEDIRRPRMRLLAWIQYNVLNREAVKQTEVHLDYIDPMRARPQKPKEKAKLNL